MEHLDVEVKVDENKVVGVSKMESLKYYPPILINIFDEDEGVFGGKSADYLGRATVFLNEKKACVAFADKKKLKDIPDPEWCDLRYGVDREGSKCGQVLCCFVIYDEPPVRTANKNKD